MDQIVEQLIQLDKKDWLDVVGIIIPIILSIIIILQNIISSYRMNKLQKQIYNRERKNQFHDEILMIYNTYYDFCDTIIVKGFENNVKNGDYNSAYSYINNLISLRLSIGRRLDLAKLIFKGNNEELYDIIEERFTLAIKIIDKYIEYINSGRLLEVSENAWNTVLTSNFLNYKYNYIFLIQNNIMYNNFIRLCESEELKDIMDLSKKYQEKHQYENFDKYFEQYFSLNLYST